ncbi:hypothetical protein NKJ46_31185 [Mesorhizobium sp. M0166]|uniref:hypothetical protein n=1 Tax=Mesorhizobium sp. M0166 TaxID=2956902 RepID=UPI00333A49C2
MITNIIDKRARPYRWKSITVIAEATWHDNTVPDSDLAPKTDGEIAYDQRECISLADAVQWANSLPGSVTLFIYDEGAIPM